MKIDLKDLTDSELMTLERNIYWQLRRANEGWNFNDYHIMRVFFEKIENEVDSRGIQTKEDMYGYIFDLEDERGSICEKAK